MAYTVLARRYRSQSFDDVVGQESTAATLKAAIATGRVAHAYLFTGTRGVGKTSMARIMASALNAPDTVPDAPKSPGAEYPPIDVQQRMADAIMRGDDLNVIEIDGASNNSVEQARQLIANAGLSPTGNALYKIYIIDEVHMLSPSAFNALLKTMEEPPAHVKFILCTTEPHKVPATIQSRCQNFNFRNIPTSRIAEHLKAVLAKEKIAADEEVVWRVARLGNGSMRDALSLLDRLLAAPEDGKVTVATLQRMLGLPPEQLVANLVDSLAAGDIKKSLDDAAALLAQGVSQDQLTTVLIERLRQLMLIAACGADSELVELSDLARQEAAAQAEKFDAPGLVHTIALCENLQRSAKSSANPRALLDATIVRLALAEKMADVTAMLAAGGLNADPKKKVDDQPIQRAGPSPAPVPQKKPEPAQDGPAIYSDASTVWRTLVEELAAKPASAWVDQLRLTRLNDDIAVLEPAPGRREIVAFMNDAKKKQIAEHLARLIGRPIRVQVHDAVGRDLASFDSDAESDDASSQGESHSPAAGGSAASTRRAAMDLPLVKQVLTVFPDATLLDVVMERA